MKINVLKVQIMMGERGLTIKKLAELSGVSRQTISRIMSGKGCTPQGILKFGVAIKIGNSNEFSYYCPDHKVWEETGYFNEEIKKGKEKALV